MSNDPADEYFHKEDQKKLEKLRQAQTLEAARAAADELKQLHFNRCGKCGHEMKTEVYRGVEIDICVSCGAVLLDPGELEALAGKDQGFNMADFFKFSLKKR